MVGEIELLRGRELDSLGTGSQAVTPRGPVDVCGVVTHAAIAFPFSMNGAVLIVGMCSTADMIADSGRYAGAIQVDPSRLVVRKLSYTQS